MYLKKYQEPTITINSNAETSLYVRQLIHPLIKWTKLHCCHILTIAIAWRRLFVVDFKKANGYNTVFAYNCYSNRLNTIAYKIASPSHSDLA